MHLFNQSKTFLPGLMTPGIKINLIGKFVLLILASALLFTGCQTKSPSTESASSAKKKTVYTSIYSVYDFTKKMAGSDFEVLLLMPPGTEAHDWEPGPQDMARISKADAFVFSGVGIEPWVSQVSSVGGDQLLIVDSSKDVPLIEAVSEADRQADLENEAAQESAAADLEDDHGQYDPHIWLDPKNVSIQMKNIADALIQLEPAKETEIEARLQLEQSKLNALDQKFSESLKAYAGRKIIVGHEAFAYLLKAYNIVQLGIEGLLSSSEPSPGHMADLIQIAKTEHIKVVFVEPLRSSKTAESLANEIGGKVSSLDPYEGLSEAEEQAGMDYYSVMEKNLTSLVDGFNVD